MIYDPTHSRFVELYPEFKDLPAERYNAWIPWAKIFLKKCRWREAWELGCYLYVAHFLILEQRNAPVADGNDSGGDATGVLTGKSEKVDDVSYTYSYNASLTALDGQGQWGATTYGQRLYQLIRMFGATPLQS